MQSKTVKQVQASQLTAFEKAIPGLLRPLLRAYILGYASCTIPRLLTLLFTHLSRRKKNINEEPAKLFLPSLGKILQGGLDPQCFPTFCAALAGGSTFLEVPLRRLVAGLATGLSRAAQLRFARCLSAFIAAWFSLKLLQSKKSDAFVKAVPCNTPDGVRHRPTRFAGRTMDLTLFAITRAVDVVVGELWSRRRARRVMAGKWNKVENAVSALTDPAIFAASSALIMWAWVYSPDRLPRSYNKWITSAAAVDQRLLQALRRFRYGEIEYGLETGQAPLIQGMCEDYGWPLHYGDPIISIPYPCEVVHMGAGTNCEYHALTRFIRTSISGLSTYLPLNLILVIRNPSKKGLQYALKSSVRSSTFLGAFTALYYYGICLGRTRAGPLIFGTSVSARQQMDSGVCVATGCAVCGWSILLENEARRKDIGLWVAPRALATLLPRRYLMEDQWKETLAFAMSTAVVFTCVGERPERVRSILGKVLHRVLYQ